MRSGPRVRARAPFLATPATWQTLAVLECVRACVHADVRETHRLVVAHIKKCRTIKNLEEATIILCLESNLA